MGVKKKVKKGAKIVGKQIGKAATSKVVKASGEAAFKTAGAMIATSILDMVMDPQDPKDDEPLDTYNSI